ncbi:MAG TPA: hypothetical protein PLF26_20160 [Blastocatellia bacterium]|nr:hypothetical protein [Blastocatellia bacterium]
MKARALVFTALALVILASPAAFAQRLPDFPGGGGPGYIPHPGIGGSVIARAYTSATLATSDGRVIGKAKTATVQTTSQLLQGLRVTVQELVAGSDYALVIDGTLVGTATSDANGILRMKFVDPVKAGGRVPAIPDAVKPIATAHSVQLYEVAGQRLVASGNFTLNGAPPK